MNRFLVFQTWGIGDMVMATPLLGALRRQVPDSHVTVIAGSQTAGEVIRESWLCDEIQVLPVSRMRITEVIRAFRSFRERHFDAAIICTRLSIHIAQCLRTLSGLRVIAGDSPPPKPWGYSHWCELDRRRSRISSNMNILRTMFPSAAEESPIFHLDAQNLLLADQLWLRLGVHGGPCLGLHPGSDGNIGKDKRIPIDVCRKLISQFHGEYPSGTVIIILGPDDMDLLACFTGLGDRVQILRDLPVRVVAGIMRRIDVLVAGDTGLGHIAAAVGTPVVTLAGPTEVSSTRPQSEHAAVVTSRDGLSCRPCYETPLYGQCPNNRQCMTSINCEEVMAHVSSLLPVKELRSLAVSVR